MARARGERETRRSLPKDACRSTVARSQDTLASAQGNPWQVLVLGPDGDVAEGRVRVGFPQAH
eukprot:5366646-Alexandrium_andersonii.AAC.1